MKKLPFILFLSLFLAGLAVCAPSVRAFDMASMARVDISGKTQNPVEFEVQAISGGQELGNPGAPQTVTIAFPGDASWREGSITILPFQSGNISLVLMGPWLRVNPDEPPLIPRMVQFDNLRIEGAEQPNGSFEQEDGQNDPKYFLRNDIADSSPPIDESNRAKVMAGDAADGGKHIRVWHNSRYGAVIAVEKDVPVTIRIAYRLSP